MRGWKAVMTTLGELIKTVLVKTQKGVKTIVLAGT